LAVTSFTKKILGGIMSVRQTSGLRGGWYVLRTALVGSALIVSAPVPTEAQVPRTLQDGVFTEAQAARGQALYAKQCASCHGNALQGAQGPPLGRDALSHNWQARPLLELVTKIRASMPADAPGTLTTQQSVDLVAHILKGGGFPANGTELAVTDAVLSEILWPSTPGAAAGAAASAAKVRAFPPSGNMAQLMRGIFFPNSNLIFTVQTHDPGAPRPAPSAGGQASGFSWVDWGAGIYSGWELVENAALALADASPLMLAPGIRCENGKLAPVNDADWIKFTEEMFAVARKTYRVAQSRNQEAVSEATGDLADACSNCHRAYRESPRAPGAARDPIDPSNKAARCRPRQ
jgi:mono/diheme cytochrome c family protein